MHYTTSRWRAVRQLALRRDNYRCTAVENYDDDGRPIRCRARTGLHVHHIEPVTLRPDLALDLDNLATVCPLHHVRWERLARACRAA